MPENENQRNSRRKATGGERGNIWYVLIPALLVLAAAFWYFVLRTGGPVPAPQGGKEPGNPPVAMPGAETAEPRGQEQEQEQAPSSEPDRESASAVVPEEVSEEGAQVDDAPPPVVLPGSRILDGSSDDFPIKGIPHSSDAPVDEPVVAAGTAPATWQEELESAKRLLGRGEYVSVIQSARSLLGRTAYASRPWRDAAALLTEANLKRYFAAARPQDADLVPYTIQPGDTLFTIATRNGIPLETLRELNHLPPDAARIYAGETLYVPDRRAVWSIRITKKYRILELMRDNRLFAVYDVGIGRIGRGTPAGEFRIYEKIENPDYIAHDGTIIHAGQPGNQLGTRWMRLSGATGAMPRGYGIHGTPNEASVGKSLSNGCIRMRNRDVEVLFSITPTGTPVQIRE